MAGVLAIFDPSYLSGLVLVQDWDIDVIPM